MRPRIALFAPIDRSTVSCIRALAGIGDIVAIATMEPEKIARNRLLSRRRAAPQWSFQASLRSCGQSPTLIAGLAPSDLTSRLEPLSPDLIVSALFPRKIPSDVLDLAELGGVNLHPARLPGLAGPQPIQGILARDRLDLGDITLHQMTSVIDAGPVIAYALLDPSAWDSPARYKTAFARVAHGLLSQALPAWLDGRHGAVQQSATSQNDWAPKLTDPIPIAPDMGPAAVQRLYAFLGIVPGVLTPDGQHRLPGPPRPIADLPEAASAKGRHAVRFKTLSTSFESKAQSWLQKTIAKNRDRREWISQDVAGPVEIRYADSPSRNA